MLLFLGLLGGPNSTLLVSSINTLLTVVSIGTNPSFKQVNSSLVFTSHDTIAYMY